MLTIAEFIHDRQRKRYRRYAAHLARLGCESRYGIVPEGTEVDLSLPITAIYGEGFFEGFAYATTLSLRVATGTVVLQTALDEALRICCVLVEEPKWLDAVRAFDLNSPDAAVLAMFGIDPAKRVKPSVAGWSLFGEMFIAPHEGGYAYFLGDPREITVVSKSATLFPVALDMWVGEVAQRSDLTGRVAKMPAE